MADLNPQQKRFCLEYLKDMNGTQAAKRAGYKSPAQQSTRLLKQEHVQHFLRLKFAKQTSSLNTSVKRILLELQRIAFSDITHYLKIEKGMLEIKDTGDWKKDSSRAVSEISETVSMAGVSKKFKLYDKLKGLELLGKYHKMFNERVEHTGADGGPIETKNSPLSPEEKAELELYRVKLGSKK